MLQELKGLVTDKEKAPRGLPGSDFHYSPLWETETTWNSRSYFSKTENEKWLHEMKERAKKTQ
jgi:hypothetical protein